MAKKSMIAREHKRARTVAKFAGKRAELKAILKDPNASEDDIQQAAGLLVPLRLGDRIDQLLILFDSGDPLCPDR